VPNPPENPNSTSKNSTTLFTLFNKEIVTQICNFEKESLWRRIEVYCVDVNAYTAKEQDKDLINHQKKHRKIDDAGPWDPYTLSSFSCALPVPPDVDKYCGELVSANLKSLPASRTPVCYLYVSQPDIDSKKSLSCLDINSEPQLSIVQIKLPCICYAINQQPSTPSKNKHLPKTMKHSFHRKIASNLNSMKDLMEKNISKNDLSCHPRY